MRFHAILSAALLWWGGAVFPASTSSVGPNGEFRLNGQPFFPIMAFSQSPNRMAHHKSIGINTFFALYYGTSAVLLVYCQQQGMWGVVPRDATINTAKAHNNLLGWCHGDEPDLSNFRVPPAAIQATYDSIRGIDSTHLVFLTLTGNFYETPDSRYTQYCQATDAVGFDAYPIYGYCRKDYLYWVGNRQDTLRNKYAKSPLQPTYQWIECEKCCSKWCYYSERSGLGPYGNEIRAEVWLAVAHGAKAIGYFPHNWRSTDCSASGDQYYSDYTTTAEQESAMAQTNREITAFTPVLCGPNSAVNVTKSITSGSGRVDLLVKEYDSQLYIVAVNVLHVSGGVNQKTVQFTVPNLSTWGSSVTVYNENRTITPSGNTFSDTLTEVNPVHIYVIGSGSGLLNAYRAPRPQPGPALTVSPNPCANRAVLSFRLDTPAAVSLTVRNLQGRLVQTLAAGAWTAGEHTAIWDGRTDLGRPAGPGMYVCELRAGDRRTTTLLILTDRR